MPLLAAQPGRVWTVLQQAARGGAADAMAMPASLHQLQWRICNSTRLGGGHSVPVCPTPPAFEMIALPELTSICTSPHPLVHSRIGLHVAV